MKIKEKATENYICKIATLQEIALKFDFEIENVTQNEKQKWLEWKENALKSVKNGERMVFLGFLDGKIITEGHVAFSQNACQNSSGLVDNETAYLFAFRTVDALQGQGYFSKLFTFIIDTMKEKGYKKATIGVEPSETKNIQIYKHLGFDKFVKRAIEYEPDGTQVLVDYYSKDL